MRVEIRKAIGWLLVLLFLGASCGVDAVGAKTLDSRVNEAFRTAFGRNPTADENGYWLGRVVRKEKITFNSLLGAMYYHKAIGKTTGSVPAARVNGTQSSGSSKQQLIIGVLPLFVKIYGNDPTDVEKAWWRKRINCGEITTKEKLEGAMTYHLSKNARKGSDAICGQKGSVALSSGVIGRKVAGISTHPMGDQVRIGIYKTGGAVEVTCNGSYQVREGANKILATLGKDDVVKVSWSGGKYHVRGSGISLDTDNKIRLVPLNQAVMQVKSYNDFSSTIPGKNYNRFRGIIEVRKDDASNELWVINELRTEYYLRGLAETSGNGPEEYLKALGVAARTYVLYHKVITGGRSLTGGWDINNTATDQIYRGYEFEIIKPRIASVFAKTKGIIVTNDQGDEPVSTVYFSDSDGRTRTAKEKWGTSKYPHLQKSVKDPHHAADKCVGHCVGMSAQGAYGFAKNDGWDFQKILKYFYSGIKLVKAY